MEIKIEVLSTNIYNAKTNFSKYIEAVKNGKEVIICSSNKPVAKLVPYHPVTKRIPGRWKNKIKISKDFDSLPKDFLKYFK